MKKVMLYLFRLKNIYINGNISIEKKYVNPCKYQFWNIELGLK